MGNVMAASPGAAPRPPISAPTGVPAPSRPGSQTPTEPVPPPEMPEEPKPGTFEDLHKKCKDIFPNIFEGAKFIVSKGLSNHLQVNHTLTMSQLQPSGYKFGATYIGSKQMGPAECYPLLVGEMDPSGNLSAQILHGFSSTFKCKAIAQIQDNKLVNSQLTADVRGNDFTSTLTVANLDILNYSGILVGHYLQRVTERLDMGAELVYQRNPQIPGREMAICTLAGRYTTDKWQLSGNITPMAAGAHLCYYQKATKDLQIGVEVEGSLQNQECTATIGYQLDLKNSVFRGQVDSNWTVGASMEKKLTPLPFTFIMSALGNHPKNAFRFGFGMILG